MPYWNEDKEEGAPLMEPRADLVEGRVALLSDPTGGAFFVYELEEAAK